MFANPLATSPFPGPIGPGLIEGSESSLRPSDTAYFPAQLGRASLKALLQGRREGRIEPFPGPIGPGLIEGTGPRRPRRPRSHFPAQLGRASLKAGITVRRVISALISRPNWAGPH